MRKILTAIFAVCTVLAVCIWIPVNAAQAGNLSWEVRDNTLYISGSGAMDNYTYGNSPWFSQAETITAVVVEEGVTSIGEYGLAGLTKATKVTLPEGLTKLSYQAFQNCAALTDIVLPQSLTYLGEIAFANCVSLKSIEIPRGITKLPQSVFYNCSSLETVQLPDTLTTVGENVFNECSALKTVVLPDSVTVIEADAFVSSGIETIVLPDNVTRLVETFRYCDSLKQVTLPENLKSVSWLFQECPALEEVVFPAGIETLEAFTINDCDNLKRIIFQGDLPQIDLSAFQIDEVEIYFPTNNETWMDVNVLKSYGADPTYYMGDADDLCDSHSFGTGSMLIPNSCVTYGSIGVPCTACSAVRLDPLRSAGHFYQRTTVPADENTVGYYEEVCFNCGFRVVTFFDNVLKSWSDAVLYLQDALAQRKTGTIEVAFWDTTPADGQKVKDLMQAAKVHNGVPAYGDYLASHVVAYTSVNSTHTQSGEKYLNILRYSVSYYSSNYEETLVNVWLTDILKQLNLEGKSDFEKVLRIHDYVVNRLRYDASLSRWSTYLALRDNATPCHGYATLMYRLLLMAGVDCRYISGDTPSGRHAWNIVKLEGKYYCLDATWDDPIIGNENHNYFLKGTAVFYEDHTPDDPYLTPEFLEAYPISETDYRQDFGYCGDDAYWCLEDDGTLVIAGQGAVEGAFNWPHSQIRHIRVGAGITQLNSSAFFLCGSLEDILFEGDKPIMGNLSLSTPITVSYPEGNATWQDPGTNTMVTWRPYWEMGQWGTNIRWVCFTDGTLEFFGTGSMKDEMYLGPWHTYDTIVQAAIYHEGITHVNKQSLSLFTKLETVTFPSTLKSIGEDAFTLCEQLKTVTFPEGLENIGDDAFYQCKGLTELLFPKSLQALGKYAFAYCYGLQKITFLGDAPVAKGGCFLSVYDVPAYYPANKPGWTEDARDKCGELLEWIPVESIQLGELSDVTGFVGKALNVTLEAQGENLHFAWYLDDQPIGKDENPLTAVATLDMSGKSLYCVVTNGDGDRVISNTVTLRIYELVTENSPLRLGLDYQESQSICFIPSADCVYEFRVTEAGHIGGALYELYGAYLKISEFTDDGFVISYHLNAGKPYQLSLYTTSMEYRDLDFSLTVTRLHDQITETVLKPFGCTEDGESTYLCGLCGQSWTQVVPAHHTYENGVCIHCGKEQIIDSGALTDTLWWELYGTTLHIFGTGDMPDFRDLIYQPWLDYENIIQRILVDEGVTAVGNYAFMYCNAVTVSLPQSVKRIGFEAFGGCKLLTGVEIPDQVTVIEKYAFRYCTDLRSLTLGNSLVTIDSYAFFGCTALTGVVFPDSLVTISDNAFYQCTAMETVIFGNGITTIGEYAFENCSLLTQVVIPDSVTTVGDAAFAGCSALTKIAIGRGVTYIPKYLFLECFNLTEISFSYSVTNVDQRAFVDCAALKDVYFAGTQAQWRGIKVGIGNTPLQRATLHLVSVAVTGDLDGNGIVDEDDAIFLLQHVLMPEMFQVEQPIDFDGSGKVDEDDAIFLLQHVLMPELFPLKKQTL